MNIELLLPTTNKHFDYQGIDYRVLESNVSDVVLYNRRRGTKVFKATEFVS